jgi:hypothetical protein
MATQKLQVGRALSVIPSNDCEVPFPAVTVSGVNTAPSTFQLVDSTKNFIALNVQTGDIVYNLSTATAATVVKVISATVLEINVSIFTTSPNSYTIYAGGNNDGCVLYIGAAGDISVVTIGGDTVTFVGVLSGQFIPVKVSKVLATTSATNILALW